MMDASETRLAANISIGLNTSLYKFKSKRCEGAGRSDTGHTYVFVGLEASRNAPVRSMKERDQGMDRRVREFVPLSPDGRIWGEIITEPLLTVAQVAATLQIREKLVRNHIKEKRLKAVKIGKYWRIKPEDLHNFIEGNSSIPNEAHPHISERSGLENGMIDTGA